MHVSGRAYKRNVGKLMDMLSLGLKGSYKVDSSKLLETLEMVGSNVKDTPCIGENFDAEEFEPLQSRFVEIVNEIYKNLDLTKVSKSTKDFIKAHLKAVKNYPDDLSLGKRQEDDFIVGDDGFTYNMGPHGKVIPEIKIMDFHLAKGADKEKDLGEGPRKK